tara:strand:- start:10 stop:1878 length:1869 start_codon:yes stop_codon:yes gene_type:complete
MNEQQSSSAFDVNNENENNTNLTAYTSTGNEDIDAIISSEEIFVVDVSYHAETESYFLTTDPDIQNALTGEGPGWGNPDDEGCSMIKVTAPDYDFECFFPYSVGRAEGKLKRLATALDFSRETIDFNSDGDSIFNAYLGNYNRDFPVNVSGGTNDSVTMFHNGTEAFLATPYGYRNEGAVWMNNIIFVTFDGPWYLNGGGFYENLPYKYHFWDISDGTPVLTHALECSGLDSWGADDFCGWDPFGIMVQSENKVYTKGRMFSQSNSGTINVKNTAIMVPIKGPDNKLYAIINGTGYLPFPGWDDDYDGEFDEEPSYILEIQEVVNDSINVSGAIKVTANDGSLPSNTHIRRSSGIAPIQYPAINLTDQYIMYVKTLSPKSPTSSIEGVSWPTEEVIDLEWLDADGETRSGISLEMFGIDNDLIVFNIPSEDDLGNSRLPDTLTINYKVNNDSEDRSFSITKSTITEFRGAMGADVDGQLKWPTPEPHREGVCILDIINNNEKCELFDDYMVLARDLEFNGVGADYSIVFGQRYDGNQAYPHISCPWCLAGWKPPGIHSIKLIDDELLIWFKESNQDKTGGILYKASGNINNFMEDGLTTFTITESTSPQKDFDLIMSLIKIE